MSEWKRNRGRKTPPCEGLVEVVLRAGVTSEGDATFFDWTIDGDQSDILKWRKVEAHVPATEKLSAADILRRAAELIEERGKQRDQENGERSMAKTVQAFNAIYGTRLTEVQGWHFMELLKMVRSAYGDYVADDFDDKVAYAALAAEAAR